MSFTYFSEERCVMCGEIIEEGTQVCARCDRKIAEGNLQAPKKTEKRKLKSLLLSVFSNRKEQR